MAWCCRWRSRKPCDCCRRSSSVSRTRTASAPAPGCGASTSWGAGCSRVWPPVSAARPACRRHGRRDHDHARHLDPASGVQLLQRRNTLYDFDERATSADARFARNWQHGLRTGVAADVLAIDTGDSGASLSADGTDVIPTIGAFLTFDTLDSSTNPRDGTWAEAEVDRLFGDAGSWTFILDGRRFQRAVGASWPRAVLAGHVADRRGRRGPARLPAVRAWRRQYACAAGALGARAAATSSSAPSNTHMCSNRFERSRSRA